MSTRDWDASTYDRISAPQERWAREQLDRLELAGSEVVLDGGCGSGRVTALLAEMLPAGRVYAVDASPSMVQHTRAVLGKRVTAYCQDLTELSLPEQVDAIFSNATFHWIADHDKLFAALASALRPGGRLVAQCGGKGNIDRLRTLADEVAHGGEFAPYFDGWSGPWNYAGAEETAQRLERAGFENVQTWLEPKPTEIDDHETFVETVCLVRHLDLLPPELHRPFVEAVLAHYELPFTLDYVRLNIVATRVDQS
jgi:trans-aconitate 2-methyltransferase